MTFMLQVVAVMLTAVAMCTALAHALEMPGKLRLGKEAYLTVQPIYYPGFTIAGVAEGLAIVAAFVLLLLLPAGSTPFRWTLAGFVALLAMHGTYWLVTHPVNRFWLTDQSLGGAGSAFFVVGRQEHHGEEQNDEKRWIRYRNRWERSHVIRAVFAVVALVALTVAVGL